MKYDATDILADPEMWEGWTLDSDIQITRRKRFHFLIAPGGRTHGIYRQLSDVLEQCRLVGIEHLLVFTADHAYMLEVRDCTGHVIAPPRGEADSANDKKDPSYG